MAGGGGGESTRARDNLFMESLTLLFITYFNFPSRAPFTKAADDVTDKLRAGINNGSEMTLRRSVAKCGRTEGPRRFERVFHEIYYAAVNRAPREAYRKSSREA